MPHILPISANDTIGEENGNYHPVFAWSTQSAEAMKHFKAHRQEETICIYEHDWSAALFFAIYGWKQEDIFL